MADGIEPCPFCGSRSIEYQNNYDDAHWYHCMECHADGPVALDEEEDFDGSLEALALWNQRKRSK